MAFICRLRLYIFFARTFWAMRVFRMGILGMGMIMAVVVVVMAVAMVVAMMVVVVHVQTALARTKRIA